MATNQLAILQSQLPPNINKNYTIDYYGGAYHITLSKVGIVNPLSLNCTTWKASLDGVKWKTTSTQPTFPLRFLIITIDRLSSPPDIYYSVLVGQSVQASSNIASKGSYSLVIAGANASIDKNIITNGKTYNGKVNMINGRSQSSFQIELDQVYSIQSIEIYIVQRVYLTPLSAVFSLAVDKEREYHTLYTDVDITDTKQNKVEKIQCVFSNVYNLAKVIHCCIDADNYFYVQQVIVNGKATGIINYPRIDVWNDYTDSDVQLVDIDGNIESRNAGTLTLTKSVLFKYRDFYILPTRDIVAEGLAFWNEVNRSKSMLAIVNRIRAIDFDQFDWHNSYPRRKSYSINLAKSSYINELDWRNQVQNNSLELWIEYIDLCKLYCDTQDEDYMLAWYGITASYFTQIASILSQKSTTGIGTLDEIFRYKHIIRTIAGFCKLVSTGSDWETVLGPKDPITQLPSWFPIKDFYTILTGLWRMQMVLHIFGHTESTKVPNQRFAAIYDLCAMGFLSNALRLEKGYGMSYFGAFLKSNFFPDGGMIEQSWNYNNDVIDSAKQIIQFSGYITSKIDGFQQYLDSLKSPIDSLPVIGTAPNVKCPMTWMNRVNVATPQLYNTIFHPYTGVQVIRTGWEWNAVWLSFINSDNLRGHRLAQNNAIELYAYGRHLLCQSGPPPYDVSHMDSTQIKEFQEFSTYFGEKSSKSRNTILINLQNQNLAKESAIVDVKTVPKSVNEEYVSGPAQDIVSGTFEYNYDAGASVIHKRRIVFDKSINVFVVYDSLTNITQSVLVSQVWNFPPLADDMPAGFAKTSVRVGPNKVYTFDSVKNPQLEIIHPQGGFSYTRFYGDKTPGDYRGWWSSSIASLRIPKVDVYCEKTLDTDTTIISVLNPIAQGERAITCSIVSGNVVVLKNGIQKTFPIN